MIRSILMCIALMMAATTVSAHSKLIRSDPAKGAVMSVLPARLTLEFATALRLTRVNLTINDGPSAVLDLGAITGFSTSYDIALPVSAPGAYAVEWRGLGADGHALTGTFMFTVL